jgi:uncharacterized protein (DUF983 family)
MEQILAASEAERHVPRGTLIPATCVCPECGTMRAIAAPVPTCAACGVAMVEPHAQPQAAPRRKAA